MNIYLVKKVSSSLFPVALALSLLAPGFASADTGFVVVDTINGNPPGDICIAGPITITGHGVEGSNGGPYNLDIEWGDGFVTHISLPDGGSHPFTFTATHTPTQVTTTFGVFLYHSQRKGGDAHFDITTFCAAPPTTAVLVVKKHVINNNGGVATAPNFTLHVKNPLNADVSDGGNGVSSPTSGSEGGKSFIITPTAGTYTVSEEALLGYTQTGITGDCTANGTITLVAGNNKSCTITNDDNVPLPTLTLVKTVVNNNGGTATAVDFQGKIDGGNVTWASAQPVSVGPHSVSETTLAGYSASVWGGDCSSSGDITLALGQNKTCTITNDDIAPLLTITKVVVNNGDGPNTPNDKVVEDFALFANLTQVLSGIQNAFSVGLYTISEDGPGGYVATYSGDCNAGGGINLGLGGIYSCTITNDDEGIPPPPTEDTLQLCSDEQDNDGDTLVDLADPDCSNFIPKLTVTKVVINGNGGTKQVSDFPLSVGDTGVVSGVQNSFGPGSFNVSESNSSGYTSSFSGGCDSNGNVILNIGDVKSCTITNDDIVPGLILQKIIVGGTATLSNFQAQVDDGINVAWFGVIPLPVGVHTASEISISGYAAGPWGGACEPNGSVTLSVGDVKTCTITNTFTPPPADVCPNLDGTQETVPSGKELVDGQCIDIVTPPSTSPEPSTPPSSSGGGGRSGDFNRSGAILGTSTGQVLGESCGLYMDKFIRSGSKYNDTGQVEKLQTFLNKWMGSTLPVSGFYDSSTLSVLKSFQEKYATNILAPWGLSKPTGLVYLTTLRWINMLECPELSLEIPKLIEWSKNPSLPQEPVVSSPSTNPALPETNEPGAEQGKSVSETQPAAAAQATQSTGGIWGFLKGLFGK